MREGAARLEDEKRHREELNACCRHVTAALAVQWQVAIYNDLGSSFLAMEEGPRKSCEVTCVHLEIEPVPRQSIERPPRGGLHPPCTPTWVLPEDSDDRSTSGCNGEEVECEILHARSAQHLWVE
jgi:hypothetical protein